MGDGDEFDLERADRNPVAELDDLQWNLRRARLAEPARLGQAGRKTRQIDGHAKARPEFGKRADVVLMRVGDDDADEILLRLLDEAEIRHDEIDARQLVAGEGDAEVDHQPLAGVRRPIAVERAIHADLAQAAERGEHELVAVCHLGSAFRSAGSRQDRSRPSARARQEPQVGRLDGLQSLLGAHEQATGRIDPLKDALALIGLVFDRDPFPQPEGAIEPGGANAVKRLSGAPDVERLAEPLNQTLKQFARTHLASAFPRQT